MMKSGFRKTNMANCNEWARERIPQPSTVQHTNHTERRISEGSIRKEVKEENKESRMAHLLASLYLVLTI